MTRVDASLWPLLAATAVLTAAAAVSAVWAWRTW